MEANRKAIGAAMTDQTQYTLADIAREFAEYVKEDKRNLNRQQWQAYKRNPMQVRRTGSYTLFGTQPAFEQAIKQLDPSWEQIERLLVLL
jgi:hypothetical protein